MEKIKAIYTFNVNLVKEIEENGEKVKKITTYPFAVRKPSRSEKEEAELVRTEYYSKYVRRGILPQAILSKTYENQGGTLTEFEHSLVLTLNGKLFAKKEELKLIIATKEKDKEKEESLLREIVEIEKELINIQFDHSKFYENTAEHKAKSKLIEYLFTTLAYWKPTEDKEWEPYFKSTSFEDALDEAEKLEDSKDEIYLKARDILMFAISIYVHSGGNVTEEDIKARIANNLSDE